MKLRSWRWGWAVAALVAGSQIWAWSQSPEARPRQALISVRAIEAEPFDAATEAAASQQQVASETTASEQAPSASAGKSESESVQTQVAQAPPAQETDDHHATVELPPSHSTSNNPSHSIPKSTTVVQAPESASELVTTANSVNEGTSGVATVASNELTERPSVRLALRQAADRGQKVVPVEPIDMEPLAPEEPRGTASAAAADATYDGVATNFKPLAETKYTKLIIERAAKATKLPQADFAAKHFEGLAPLSTDAVRSSQAPPRLTGPTAGDFCYRPLYFQETNLERYGSSWGFLQPAVSGARFFATVPALPYLMAVDSPNECYDWSYPYPAGFPAPRVREMPPLSVKGGLLEAGVMTGLIFLIP